MYYPQIKGLKIYVSEIRNGNMSFRWGTQKEVLGNREKFFENKGINKSKVVCMEVSSKEHIKIATKADAGCGSLDLESAIPADALITNVKGLSLMLMVADCIPAIVYDSTNNILALAHINYMNSPIVKKLLDKMTKEFKSNIKDLKVYFGPSIKKESYIIENPKQKDEPSWKPFLIQKSSNQYIIDLFGYIKNNFLLAGIDSKNIFISDVDTFKSTTLFSHYRANRSDEEEGRFAVIVTLE